MQIRYQGEVDTIFIPSVRYHPLDLSQTPEYNRGFCKRGCPAWLSMAAQFRLKSHFERSKFKEVDMKCFLPDFE